MKYITTICAILLCAICGILFHAYQKEWVIILLPYQTARCVEHCQEETPCVQEKIILYFWKQGQWHQESNSIIWSSDIHATIKTIINHWLTLLEDEKLIDNDIQLISVVITPHKELLLSFNKNICNPQDATYHTLMLMHALLKTLHDTKLPIQSVRFLVHHQIMTDDHLNFAIPWPITGYMDHD